MYASDSIWIWKDFLWGLISFQSTPPDSTNTFVSLLYILALYMLMCVNLPTDIKDPWRRQKSSCNLPNHGLPTLCSLYYVLKVFKKIFLSSRIPETISSSVWLIFYAYVAYTSGDDVDKGKDIKIVCIREQSEHIGFLVFRFTRKVLLTSASLWRNSYLSLAEHHWFLIWDDQTKGLDYSNCISSACPHPWATRSWQLKMKRGETRWSLWMVNVCVCLDSFVHTPCTFPSRLLWNHFRIEMHFV